MASAHWAPGEVTSSSLHFASFAGLTPGAGSFHGVGLQQLSKTLTPFLFFLKVLFITSTTVIGAKRPQCGYPNSQIRESLWAEPREASPRTPGQAGGSRLVPSRGPEGRPKYYFKKEEPNLGQLNDHSLRMRGTSNVFKNWVNAILLLFLKTAVKYT